ncbi:MAG: glycosyltransferase family 4 protein [Bacteroidales bacterium]
MERVLMITYYWPPSGGPGVQRPLKFVKYLPAQGFQPLVITVDPERAYYPLLDPGLEKDIPPEALVFRTPTFEPFALYEKLTGKNKMPKPGFAGEGKPGRLETLARFIRGNLFVPDPRRGWNRFLIRQALEVIGKYQPLALITSSPPHSTQLAGQQLKKRTGLPWIADLRDPWTDIYYYKEFRHLPWIRKKDAAYERRVLEEADAVLVVSEALKRLFLTKSPRITPEKIHVIPNGYDPVDFPEKPCRGKNEQFTLVYTGTLSSDYPVEALAKAFQILSNRHSIQDIILQVVGKASPQLQETFIKCNLGERVKISPYVPHSEAISRMQCADALLLIIPKVSNNEGILTGKLFEYLATGVPIAGLGPVEGDAAAILSETGAGRMIAYDDAEALAEWLLEIYQHRSETHVPSEAAVKYSRPALTHRLAQIIQQLR